MSDPIVGVVEPTAPGGSRTAWGYALALTGVVLFAVNGTVAKGVLLSGVDPLSLSALRIIGAAVLLVIAGLLIAPGDMRISPRELPALLAYGIAGVTLTQVLYFIAIERMPIAVALVIEFTAPVMVALWARFVQHQAVRPLVWGALALALVGLTCVTEVWSGPGLSLPGVLAAVGAAIALAIYFIGGEHYVRRRSPIATAALAMTAGALMMAIVRPPWLLPWAQLTAPASDAAAPWLAGPLWLSVGWMIVLGTFIPFIVTFAALRHLPARQAIVVAMIEPVVAALVAYLVLGEALAAIQVLGGAMVLTGVALAEIARLPRSPAGVPPAGGTAVGQPGAGAYGREP